MENQAKLELLQMGHVKLPGGLKCPTDFDELKKTITTVETRLQPIPKIRRHVSRFVDGADMDEVYPKLWLGDCDAATNIGYLQRHGITHILNAAANKTGPAPVKTGKEFYKDTKFDYLGLDLIDLPFANVVRHFEATADYIDKAFQKGGTVFVHCRQGRSRSASIVIGFLMIKRNFTSGEALRRLREFREVRPNSSFLQQIADYDLQLFRERLAHHRSQLSSSSDSDSNTDEIGKESIDTDSFKTVYSEPNNTDSAPDLQELSLSEESDIEEIPKPNPQPKPQPKPRQILEWDSETIYIPNRSSVSNDKYEFASFKELSTEFSIQLVIDSDYDSDDESSDNNDDDY